LLIARLRLLDARLWLLSARGEREHQMWKLALPE
jgi:hypothetical protein